MTDPRHKNRIDDLLAIMARLRDPESGCPWDREQTFATIAPYTIEEAYEVADAIERDDMGALAEELGDLLFQVVFHARLAEEAGTFDFSTVVVAICEKLRRRHPHVFGGSRVASAAAQSQAWESMKRREREAAQHGALAGVPVGMPGLTRALKLGQRAAAVGFDWPSPVGVRAKLDEELGELDAAIAVRDQGAVAAEMGDLMLTLASLCRHLDLDPESCLRTANARFAARFAHVEAAVQSAGGDWSVFDSTALDALWAAAKRAAG